MLSSLASDPAALDACCSLSVRVDRVGVSNAALAAASADIEPAIAAVARALLHVRSLLRDAAAASQAGASEAARAAEAEARYKVFPDSSAVAREDAAAASRSGVGGDAAAASLEDAVRRVRAMGCDVVEVPRALLRAIGESDSQAVRILRAAFSHDNDALVRAMSVDFDVAELRAATRQTAGKSLRAGLGTAVGAFLGLASRERGLAWAQRLERIRRSGRKKKGALAAAVDATGVDDARLRAEAVAADAVWEALEGPPSVTTRIALLCDSLVSRVVDDRTVLAPFGSQEPDGKVAAVRFETDASAIIDLVSFARAIDADEGVLEALHVKVSGSLYESAACWLEEHHRDRAAYAWPTGEGAERVVAPSMTFSASRLNLYAKCPRRWYYEYLCAAVEEKTTSHAVYGKVFHGALEALHRDVRVPADWDRTEVLDRLLGLLDVAFGQAHHEFASQLEYEVLRLRARQVAQHYVRWLYEEAADAPLEIVEVESRQTLTLRGHRFVGFIDRVDRPPGGGPVTIFDYKTGRIEDDPAEYLRQVRSGEEAQLAIYYAMRRAQGDDVARIALVSIRDARAKTWILALDITDDEGRSVVHRADRLGVVRASCSIADLERSLDVLTARADLMTREGIEHFEVGTDPPCLFCAYALSCRERPADGERIFAR